MFAATGRKNTFKEVDVWSKGPVVALDSGQRSFLSCRQPHARWDPPCPTPATSNPVHPQNQRWRPGPCARRLLSQTWKASVRARSDTWPPSPPHSLPSSDERQGSTIYKFINSIQARGVVILMAPLKRVYCTRVVIGRLSRPQSPPTVRTKRSCSQRHHQYFCWIGRGDVKGLWFTDLFFPPQPPFGLKPACLSAFASLTFLSIFVRW